MKKITFLLSTILLLTINLVFGQEKEINVEKEKVTAGIQSLPKSELQRIQEVINNYQNRVKVGSLRLFKTQVRQYSKTEPLKDKGKGKLASIDDADTATVQNITIDSVLCLVENGLIVEIQVFADKGVRKFINSRATISVDSQRLLEEDFLSDYQGKYVLIRDFLQYTSYNSYIPDDDGYFVLKKLGDLYVFSKGKTINDYLDIRLYTDALATFAEKPNGLVQTDINFRHIWNRKNLKNSGAILFYDYKAKINLSKFDSKIGVTDVGDFSRISLIQRSWLSVETSFNVLNYWIAKRSLSRGYLEVGAGSNISNIARDKDTISTTSSFIFFEKGFDLKMSDNFSGTIAARTMFHYGLNIDLEAPTERTFFLMRLGLNWSPFENKRNSFFTRVVYTKDIAKPKDQFLQVQFGSTIIIGKK